MPDIEEFIIVFNADTDEAEQALSNLDKTTKKVKDSTDSYNESFIDLNETISSLDNIDVKINPDLDEQDQIKESITIDTNLITDEDEDSSINVNVPDVEPQEVNVNVKRDTQIQEQQSQSPIDETQLQRILDKEDQETEQQLQDQQEINIDLPDMQGQDAEFEETNISENFIDNRRNIDGDEITLDQEDIIIEEGDVANNVAVDRPVIPDINTEPISPKMENEIQENVTIDQSIQPQEQSQILQPIENFIPPLQDDDINVSNQDVIEDVPRDEEVDENEIQPNVDVGEISVNSSQETKNPTSEVEQVFDEQQPIEDIPDDAVQQTQQNIENLNELTNVQDINIDQSPNIQNIENQIDEVNQDINVEQNNEVQEIPQEINDVQLDVEPIETPDIMVDTPEAEQVQGDMIQNVSMNNMQQQMFMQNEIQEQGDDTMNAEITSLIARLASMDFEAPINTQPIIDEEKLSTMLYNVMKYGGDGFQS